MEGKVLSQKEYLKKYLSSGDGEHKKKKKKKLKVGSKTVKIIDDDIDLKNMRPIEDNEFDIFLDAEDAPQIAGVVDERGPVDFSDKRRWKIIANREDGDLTITSHGKINEHKGNKQPERIISDDDLNPPRKQKQYSDDDLSPPRISKPKKKKEENGKRKKVRNNDDSDLSPPRKHKSAKHKSSKHKRQPARESSDSESSTEVNSRSRKKKSKQKEKTYDSDLSPPRRNKNMDSDLSPPRRKKNEDSDLSPPRRKKNEDSDLSPPRRQKNEDSDLSPPRRKKNYDSDLSPPRNNKHDSDLSPPRRNKNHETKQSRPHDVAGPSKISKMDSDSDLSPPRKNKHYESRHRMSRHNADAGPAKISRKDNDSDLSPPRKSRKHYDSDLSPPRRNKMYRNSHTDSKHKNRNDDSDLSPPRQHRHKTSNQSAYDESRNRKHSDRSRTSKRQDSDLSPPRKKHRDSGRNSSPPSKSREHSKDYHDRSRRDGWEDKYEHAPKRRSDVDTSHRREKYSRWNDDKRLESRHASDSEEHHNKRMKKTLDGKTAGLQDAKALREETEAHKKREAEHFSKLSKEVSGVGQAVIVRDSKTGKKRNLEAEAAEEREKQKRQAELDEKYAKWGKGLKQVEDRAEQLKDDLYEMSKPLARYADDADLDKRLRDQDREGDPMLEYIKQKQIKEGKRKPDRPTYQGSYMPNRFGIKPGHRWDGVDRSNGYEKRWFEAQNAKVARQEEAYKWSTSDM